MRHLYDHVTRDEVVINGQAFWWSNALGGEKDGGPEAHRFVDDGVEQWEGSLAVIVHGTFAEFLAYGTHVFWMGSKLHHYECECCGGCLATSTDDEARFAVEQLTTSGVVGCSCYEVRN